MIQVNNKIDNSAVAELFFDNPESAIHIRELARKIHLHPNTVLRDVKLLVKENLLSIKKTRAITEIRANRETAPFLWRKRIHNLRKIHMTGIIEILNKEYAAPEAIILFGSFSRGEDTERSDIDIALITSRKEILPLTAFEKALGRTIQLHLISHEKVSKEFLNTLANGIVLKGYLQI